MRKHIILAAIAALASFTACSNEEEEEEQIPGAEVNFTINNTVTRAITNATGLTTFGEGDKVYIYSKGLYAQEMEGVEFKVNGNSLTQSSTEVTYRYNGTKGATFTAYHYNNTTISDGNITVGSDQSEEGDFQRYDLMTAQVTASNPTGNPINFEFKHRFSLVKVDVSAIESVGLTISSVTINNVKCTATWNSDDNSINVSGDAMSVIMGQFGSSSKEFWAIIPAQTISAEDLIEVVTTTNKVYTYTGTENVTFDEGKMKKFTLRASGFNTVSATISASSWTEDTGVTGTADERILELITEQQGTFSANTNINTFNQAVNVAYNTQLTEGWYSYKKNNASKIEYSTTEAGILFQPSTTGWTDTNFFFVFNPNIIRKSISKKFTLSFKRKFNSSNTSGNAMRMCIGNIGTDINLKSYSLDNAYKWKYVGFDGNNGYVNMSMQIDFNKYGESSTVLNDISTIDYTNVALMFVGVTTEEIYIKDVNIKEVVPE